jgi:glyoxylase-like metal-dependent hydrolase (beta-lactamase superfamily II)
MRALFQLPGWLRVLAWLAGAAVLLAGRALTAAAAEPYVVSQLTRIADDVYVFSMTEYNSLFIVTDAGVILVDPIGPTRAPLLKAAVASVTDQPVRYVIYAHDHADHISGGAIFADTAQFVSQANAVGKVASRADPLTPVPTMAFDDYLQLELGGTSVDLYYVGLGHSDNNLLLVYPAQRIAFGADFIETRSLFTGQLSPWINSWVDSFTWIDENLDFDVLVAGHGVLGTKATFLQARQYFLDLVAAVRAARAAGLEDGSDEMVTFVRTQLAPTYGSWAHFDERIAANVGGIIRNWEGL